MITEANCLVAQSGGPTTVINASLAGVISRAMESGDIQTIYGAVNGIQGVLEEKFLNLSEIFLQKEGSIELLKNTPAMYLGSCRYKLDDYYENRSDYITIFNIFKKYHIKYFFYIGGNDSMDTVAKLSAYANSTSFDIRILGIPKTIDNDLMCIDHTPGFGSAAKFIASSILEVAHDTYIYDTKSVTIIEIMGRNAGWLTASAALARNQYSTAPHLIYLPEKPFSIGGFLSDVKKQLFLRKHVIIAVSEGVRDQEGSYISAEAGITDQFGHVMLSGTGKYLEGLVQNTIGCKVRSIELNVLQRCASHASSLTDINESFALGEYGVTAALEGHTSQMVTLTRISNHPYTVEYGIASIDKIANFEKTVPAEWINQEGNDVSEEIINYVRPLIMGESNTQYLDGMPVYLPVDHLQQ